MTLWYFLCVFNTKKNVCTVFVREGMLASPSEYALAIEVKGIQY